MVLRSFARCASTVAKKTLSRGSGRNEITSQQLCDDILDRLRTSLPAPNTCDIIDINPGQGIWSKSLHRIIQPRRHVLVESNLEKYAEHLQPLLTSQSSAYRHSTVLEDVFDPTKQLLTQNEVEKAASVGKQTEYNRCLLMTVNLSGAKVSIGGYMGSLSRKFFDELYLSVLASPHNGFFRYGLIRVLAWIPDHEKDSYIPRTVHARHKQTIMLEATTEIAEVAGASAATKSTRYRKWPDLELEEIAVINARAKDSGYKMPKSRLDAPPPRELLSIEPTPRNLRKADFTSDAEWVPRLLELDSHIKKKYPHWYRKYALGQSIRKLGLKTPLQKEWGELLRRANTTHKTHMKAVELVNQERKLVSDWKREISNAQGKPIDPDTELSLQKRAETIKEKLKALNRTNRIFAEKAIDDCRAWDMSPPILAWNRREAHPLTVYNGEFDAPNRQMALLDVIPRGDLILKVNTYDKMVCFRHIVTTLSLYLSRSVAEALRALVHEGLDEFVKTIPGIHDPTKGGWYDLTTLRVRVLPTDMFVEIGLAYEKWPFRMSTEAILMTTADPTAGYSGQDDDMK
ncbi:hypothetical protein AYO21_06959 [Fonsecaea monophora]|uniref:Uncharacterized protein n=1 Tax=Fonsecaea monophora TaxID=254056 RepID=A0A177F355_9EURO|nr:hypothetical protein AYO21_06959 [Fonsecaea monophora]KAH0845858.1 hypothetical protein FOPE_11506 [Fonsecaea pedrosoi]OAG38764.1 hypothetical protein AYO21_06959 [Fonsecaea monophora]